MGRIQDSIQRVWKTLSTADVTETQEYNFGGELAIAMQVQKKEEESQESLLSSFHNKDDNGKNYRVDNIDEKENEDEGNKNKENVQKIVNIDKDQR